LHTTQRQVVNNGGTGERTYYVYDATGQRVRKVTERQATPGNEPRRKEERIYLGGFEIYRQYNGDGSIVTLERETLHITGYVQPEDQQQKGKQQKQQDNAGQCIVLIETRTKGDDGSPVQIIRYQFNNHLGSATLELDELGGVISYEEYYP